MCSAYLNTRDEMINLNVEDIFSLYHFSFAMSFPQQIVANVGFALSSTDQHQQSGSGPFVSV